MTDVQVYSNIFTHFSASDGYAFAAFAGALHGVWAAAVSRLRGLLVCLGFRVPARLWALLRSSHGVEVGSSSCLAFAVPVGPEVSNRMQDLLYLCSQFEVEMELKY
jgi:hypothetical protein